MGHRSDRIFPRLDKVTGLPAVIERTVLFGLLRVFKPVHPLLDGRQNEPDDDDAAKLPTHSQVIRDAVAGSDDEEGSDDNSDDGEEELELVEG